MKPESPFEGLFLSEAKEISPLPSKLDSPRAEGDSSLRRRKTGD
jgi:hypothetical protein